MFWTADLSESTHDQYQIGASHFPVHLSYFGSHIPLITPARSNHRSCIAATNCCLVLEETSTWNSAGVCGQSENTFEAPSSLKMSSKASIHYWFFYLFIFLIDVTCEAIEDSGHKQRSFSRRSSGRYSQKGYIRRKRSHRYHNIMVWCFPFISCRSSIRLRSQSKLSSDFVPDLSPVSISFRDNVLSFCYMFSLLQSVPCKLISPMRAL